MSNALKQISAQAINILLSVLIINQYSKSLWGNFSTYLIYASIISIITSWGNKEYLMRAFSKTPAQIKQLFYAVFNTRLLLLSIAIGATFLFYSFEISCYLSLWISALYITQSLEVFLNYKKNFGAAMLIELFALGLLLFCLHYSRLANVTDLLKLFGVYNFSRAIIYTFLFGKEIGKPTLNFQMNYFIEAGIFLIMGLIGFLQSRTDFILVAYFESEDNVAMYQVINSYFILIHAISTFLIFPFIKNIYRLNENAVKEFQRKIVFVAPFILVLALFFLYLLTNFVFHFNLPYLVYFLGFGIAYPPYFYAVKIFEYYKHNQQNFVLRTGLIAIFINATITLILLNTGFGYIGALIASVAAHTYTALQYYFSGNKNRNKPRIVI